MRLKSISFVIVLAFLMAGESWGASTTKTVCASGCDYTSVPTAITALQAIAPTGTDYGQGHTLNISAGTYTDAESVASVNLAHSNLKGITINGAGRSSTFIQTASQAYRASSSTTGITVNNLTFLGQTNSTTNVAYMASGTATTFNNVDFISQYLNQYVVANQGSGIFNKCGFYGSGTSSGYLYDNASAGSGSTAALNYCLGFPTSAGTSHSGIRLSAANVTTTITNLLTAGAASQSILISNGTLNLYNSVSYGAGENIKKSGGTVNLYNNYLPETWQYGNAAHSAVDTDSNNIETNADPAFTSYSRPGYIIMSVDDYANIDYATSVGDILDTYGYHGTFSVNTALVPARIISDPTWLTKLKALVTSGKMEVACHTYSHSDLKYTHALRFSQTGGSNCTVAFDGTTITENCDGTDYDNTYTTTGKTIAEVITALHGVKGWTVAKSSTDGQTASQLYDTLKASSFATLTATSAPCDIDLNITGPTEGYFKDEMTDPKAYLETILADTIDGQTGIQYVANSFVFPFDESSAVSRAAAITAGFWSARTRDTSSSAMVPSVDLSNLVDSTNAITSKATEAPIRQYARGLAIDVLMNGRVLMLLAHSEADVTLERLGWLFDELSKFPDLAERVISQQQFANIVRTSGLWTNTSGSTWTRSYPVAVSGYTLQSTSPLKNAGTTVTGVHTVSTCTDYAGAPCNQSGTATLGN